MSFRVHVPGISYRGSDARRQEKMRRDHRLCGLIRDELQRRYDEIKPGEWRAIMSHQIASSIGEDAEEVRLIMCRIQGGSNGVTFHKPAEPDPGDRSRFETAPASEHVSRSGLRRGEYVTHDAFGRGRIVHISDDRVEVDFEEAGTKRLSERFVRPWRA